jgi:L-threonylcarbamoyladenylate synthase
MQILNHPTQVEIKKSAKALKDGNLVAFPTETVYGLGADASSKKAVSRMYAAKARPTGHPVIVHISSVNKLDKWAINVPDYAMKLAANYWPGPITLILKRSDIAQDFITGSQDKVGIRIPAHPIALELLYEFERIGGLGIAAPSANRFGSVSATTAKAVVAEVGKYLGGLDLVLDGGQCLVGVESTIVDCTQPIPIVLRPGAISSEMINSVTASNVEIQKNSDSTKASGLLRSHYSPKARVELNAKAESQDGFIAMSSFPTPLGAIRLAAPTNISEYAQELYEALRFGDSINLKRIIVFPPEGDGLAEAVRDRLEKAAQGQIKI